MTKKTTGIIFCLTAVLFILSGCQTYSPEPVNLELFGEAWESQLYDDVSVSKWLDSSAAEEKNYSSEKFSLDDGISLEEARKLLLWLNPVLQEKRAEAGVAYAKRDHTGKWMDPVLQSILGHKKTDEDTDGFFINEFRLELTVPLSGRPRVLRAIAESEADAADDEILLAEFNMLNELNQVWAEIQLTAQKKKLLEEHLHTLEKLEQSTEILADSGEIYATESRLLQIANLQNHNLLYQLNSSFRLGKLEVYTLLGLHPMAEAELDTQAVVDSINLSLPDDTASLVLKHPEVILAQSEYTISEQQLKLEVRKQYPDLKFSPGFSDEGPDSVLDFGLGLPVAVWNRNAEGIAVAEKKRTVAGLKLKNTYRKVFSEIESARLNVEAAEMSRKLLETETVPLADRQLEEVTMLLSYGELNILLLHSTLQGVLQIKMDWLNAESEVFRTVMYLNSFLNSFCGDPHNEVQESEDE